MLFQPSVDPQATGFTGFVCATILAHTEYAA